MRPRIAIAFLAALLLALVLVPKALRRSGSAPAATADTAVAATAPRSSEQRPFAAPVALPVRRSVPVPAAGQVAPEDWREQLFSLDMDARAVPREVLDAWLASGRTNAPDLLAMRQVGGGAEFLRLALTNFPSDPRVLMAAVALDDGPQARRERLDRLKAAAPDNALADYLSARDHLKQGRTDAAFADLAAASGKARFDDYVLEAMVSAEELYLQDGRSPAEAKALGTSGALMPHLAQLKGLAVDLAELQGQYLAAGDTGSAERLAQYGVELGGRLIEGEGSNTLIGQLVGVAVEKIVLKPLDPDRAYDFLQGTVNERQAALEMSKAEVRESSQHFEDWMRAASEAEIVGFFDRFKLYGEAEALKWLAQRRGAP
jgi:hypothetical protein